MQNSTSTIIAIFAAVVLVLVVPIVTLTQRNDDVASENVKKIVEEFVTDIKNTGELTTAKYQDFQNKLNATGNTYKIEMEIQHIDENPGQKVSQANYTKIGENVYWSEYTSQIEGSLNRDGKISLKEGDIVYVGVSNESSTAAQSAEKSLLNVSNEDEEVISASSSGMVTTDGN